MRVSYLRWVHAVKDITLSIVVLGPIMIPLLYLLINLTIRQPSLSILVGWGALMCIGRED